jgi:hypothetical protein
VKIALVALSPLKEVNLALFKIHQNTILRSASLCLALKMVLELRLHWKVKPWLLILIVNN